MTIEEHLLNVKTNIKTALEKSGKTQRVEIVAATKTQTFFKTYTKKQKIGVRFCFKFCIYQPLVGSKQASS